VQYQAENTGEDSGPHRDRLFEKLHFFTHFLAKIPRHENEILDFEAQ